jgi:CDP-paratose 2-epimerase
MKGNVLITGSSGLIGSEAVKFFSNKNFDVFGIDNDMRKYFFGESASTKKITLDLKRKYPNYQFFNVDIRDKEKIKNIFKKTEFNLIIHTAAQPSHDWAAKEPFTDFEINANGTLNLLENFRKYCSDATFIFTSTNKVYGDSPNKLPLIEKKTRYEIDQNHKFSKGIDESMTIDNSKHSLFGVSKVSADLLVQEYGKYFDLKTGCFRGGCLTGPSHCGAELHGFLAYLVKCIATEKKYTIFGYKGKQVRDNIHSYDVINSFFHFFQNPKKGEVYNIGGTRHSNISVVEAINSIEEILEKEAVYEYSSSNREGDHKWYISNMSKFKKDFPKWEHKYNINDILKEICLPYIKK